MGLIEYGSSNFNQSDALKAAPLTSSISNISSPLYSSKLFFAAVLQISHLSPTLGNATFFRTLANFVAYKVFPTPDFPDINIIVFLKEPFSRADTVIADFNSP